VKRVLPLVAIVLAALLLTVVLVHLGIMAAWKHAGRQPWPMELGTLEDFDERFPKQGTSAAALELARLAKPLRIDFAPKAKNPDPIHKAITEYTKVHHSRNTAKIDAPPAEIVAYFYVNDADIDAVRAHLLSSGGDIAWPVDLSKGFNAPLPNLLAHMQLARLFIARALTRGEWEDLHAAMILGRSVYARPDTISQLIALAIARSVNAASWKLPPPAPPWLAELGAVDHRRLMLRAAQSDTWVLWQFGHQEKKMPFGEPGRPYFRASIADLALHQRETAIQLAMVRGCGFDSKAFEARRMAAIPRWNIIAKIAVPDFGGIWSRVLRYDIEREVAANALRIRGGQPAVKRSSCREWETVDASPPMPIQLVVAHDSATGDHGLDPQRDE
jgi:hypothetical protein